VWREEGGGRKGVRKISKGSQSQHTTNTTADTD